MKLNIIKSNLELHSGPKHELFHLLTTSGLILKTAKITSDLILSDACHVRRRLWDYLIDLISAIFPTDSARNWEWRLSFTLSRIFLFPSTRKKNKIFPFFHMPFPITSLFCTFDQGFFSALLSRLCMSINIADFQ